MNAIEIRGLAKNFSDFKLGELSLELPRGCIMGLIGENGAGKTTTIKLLLGMLKQDSGTISVLGQEVKGDTRALKEKIGVCLDEPGIPACLTPKQVSRIMDSIFIEWDRAAFEDKLKKFDIPENKKFEELSKGMKMKLGLAVAMSHGAELLILDEATSGLDPVARDDVAQMLIDFTRDEKHSILLSSHIVSDIEKLCDYVAFIHKGKLMLMEEKDALLGKYGIIHCTSEQLGAISGDAVKYKRSTSYGTEAIVLRDYVPDDMRISPVSVEELFVIMAREGR